MDKIFTGLCPAQNKEYSISVEYYNVSTPSEIHYTRGLMDCDYRIKNGCAEKHCPLLDLAPKNI